MHFVCDILCVGKYIYVLFSTSLLITDLTLFKEPCVWPALHDQLLQVPELWVLCVCGQSQYDRLARGEKGPHVPQLLKRDHPVCLAPRRAAVGDDVHIHVALLQEIHGRVVDARVGLDAA
jgi:hypothetical protein